MKRKVHYREPMQSMDLRGDYMFSKEMIKGDTKKILQKDTRRRLKNQTKEEIKNIMKDN